MTKKSKAIDIVLPVGDPIIGVWYHANNKDCPNTPIFPRHIIEQIKVHQENNEWVCEYCGDKLRYDEEA